MEVGFYRSGDTVTRGRLPRLETDRLSGSERVGDCRGDGGETGPSGSSEGSLVLSLAGVATLAAKLPTTVSVCVRYIRSKPWKDPLFF